MNQYENLEIKLPDLLLIEYPTTYSGEDNVTNSLIQSIKDLVFDPVFFQNEQRMLIPKLLLSILQQIGSIIFLKFRKSYKKDL